MRQSLPPLFHTRRTNQFCNQEGDGPNHQKRSCQQSRFQSVVYRKTMEAPSPTD